MSDDEMAAPRIVVGVDGSDPSKAALWWAVRQAGLIGGVVEAVAVWEYPSAWYGWTPPQAEVFDYEKNAGKTLVETIDRAIGPDRPVEIRTRVVRGHPAAVLLDAARGAHLLVVGNRGHGGFAGALLGSVGQHCVQHASCPVVIVRGPGEGSGD
ncbi:nucleotide-binding universal stress UspA family protein [Kitasatospora sp. MAP12-15]|uniref:universal stress protein n=1 Tax=unclassified Kitasatospora TaxID=2633591 RepID=UPI0024764139|nr:universal stress protein [Kitasatospora sp. MAP12-44]MDH6115491.1 nucleotide-binding universal stress UspA family protein [Kitasatospora sp. MAP12-44]